jgi:hypothetical protein
MGWISFGFPLGPFLDLLSENRMVYSALLRFRFIGFDRDEFRWDVGWVGRWIALRLRPTCGCCGDWTKEHLSVCEHATITIYHF